MLKEKEENEWEKLKDHTDRPSCFDGFLSVKQSKMLTLKSSDTCSCAHTAHHGEGEDEKRYEI